MIFSSKLTTTISFPAILMGTALLMAFLLMGCAEPQSSTAQNARISSQRGLAVVPLTISGGGPTHRFNVEIAQTGEQQATGLMFVGSLRPNDGMIFPFSPPRPASFWMKNTLIPLDMIFVRQDCSIAKIAVNTVPQTLDPVGTEEPVVAVLEIAGGRSVELGINEGDCVSWPGGPPARS